MVHSDQIDGGAGPAPDLLNRLVMPVQSPDADRPSARLPLSSSPTATLPEATVPVTTVP